MDEILTIEEVAAYLRVSERTVYDWASKGELPGGKLGTSWRFRRSDIERWVNDRLSAPGGGPGKGGVTASSTLTPERVIVLEEASKEEVLLALVNLLAESPFVSNRETLLKGILDREALMSTGIGFGVGVPHVRIDSVRDIVMAMAVCKRPVADYESLDDVPVQIVCMVAARPDQHAQYLRTLSTMSARLKDPLMRERIIHSSDPVAIYNLMTGTEQ
jgi:nitrogen PTS system EIIA component